MGDNAWEVPGPWAGSARLKPTLQIQCKWPGERQLAHTAPGPGIYHSPARWRADVRTQQEGNPGCPEGPTPFSPAPQPAPFRSHLVFSYWAELARLGPQPMWGLYLHSGHRLSGSQQDTILDEQNCPVRGKMDEGRGHLPLSAPSLGSGTAHPAPSSGPACPPTAWSGLMALGPSVFLGRQSGNGSHCRVRCICLHIPAQPLPSCVSADKQLNLSEPLLLSASQGCQ